MSTRRHRCAVVDDSPVVLDLLRILLTAAGWDVATYSEVAALELRLRAWCPDVILLDVGMPGVGLEGLRQRVVLLHVATGAKVLLHSARDAAETQETLRIRLTPIYSARISIQPARKYKAILLRELANSGYSHFGPTDLIRPPV